MKGKGNSKAELYEILRLKQKLELPEEPIIPRSLRQLLSPTVKNYFAADFEHQRLARMTIRLRGKTDKYVFQISNGSQQIKLYEPHKYKNDVYTPLRLRTRMIMHLAYHTPCSDVKEKIRELHCTYPYYLLKDKPVHLRLLNFRFEPEAITGDELDLYEKRAAGEPDPETDRLLCTLVYRRKKSIEFVYQDQDEQFFYALNRRNGKLSNLLHFIWQDELQQIPR
jgi:hypothetical protein